MIVFQKQIRERNSEYVESLTGKVRGEAGHEVNLMA